MCLSARHLDILRTLNEQDLAARRASPETYDRFREIFERCARCPHFDNGAFGDVRSECRQAFLRLFISMKRDAESYLIRKRLEAPRAAPLPELPPPPPSPLPPPSTPPPVTICLNRVKAERKKSRRARKKASS